MTSGAPTPPNPALPAPRLRVSAAGVGLALAAIVAMAGWLLPIRDYVSARYGLGYALGVTGGSMMMLLLIYSLRKRTRRLALVGSTSGWFNLHVVFGVIGPILILYHSAYRTGATNSSVALWSMLAVVGSGLVGRYLQGRVHLMSHGRELALTELRADADRRKFEVGAAGSVLATLGDRIEAAERRITRGFAPWATACTARVIWHWERARLRRYVRTTLQRKALTSTTIAAERSRVAQSAARYSDLRLSAARRLGEVQGCAQLMAAWHVLHTPLVGLLFFAGIVHVLAVSIY